MTDERFVYNADLRDRKRAAQGALAKKGGSRSKSCTLPSDALSASQKRKLNGSVESINLNKPMNYARLKELTPTLQILYLDHLVSTYNARCADLVSMLGIARCTFYKLQNASTPPSPPEAPQEPVTVQEPSLVVPLPVVLSGSVTVRCTASHVLDALLRLIDDPEREYTFTVSFER